jgi:hypothetical protein
MDGDALESWWVVDLALLGLGLSAIGATWLAQLTVVPALGQLSVDLGADTGLGAALARTGALAGASTLAAVVPWIAAVRIGGSRGRWLRGLGVVIALAGFGTLLWAAYAPVFEMSGPVGSVRSDQYSAASNDV